MKENHTASSATKLIESTRAICELVGINKDDWLSLFFETGCRYAEASAPDLNIAYLWLTNSRFGFWSSFLVEYTQDDATILNWDMVQECGLTYDGYARLKSEYSIHQNDNSNEKADNFPF